MSNDRTNEWEDSRARLAAIIDSSDDAIVSKDLDGYVTSWNRGAERLFGYTAAEMIGQHITKIIPEARHTEEDFVLGRVRAGLGVDHFQTVRLRKDGSFVDISLTVSPIRSADGRVIGVSKIARDITEAGRLERDALRLAAIVESSEDAIIGKDLDGIIQSWNEAAERIFGYPAREAIGRSISLIVPDDRREEQLRALEQVRRGTGVTFETIRCRKGGQLIDISVTVSPIRARSGEIIGASKIARDITEEKRLRKVVEETGRAKDEFLAMLSHELRTPLNTVVGYTQMLRRGVVSEAEMTKALDAISKNAEALTQLVNDVLDTSRIVTGKIHLKMEPCDVGLLADEAIASIHPVAETKSIRVSSNIAHGLHVAGDRDRLRQVLWNLLSNAVKFTPAGGTVMVTARQEQRAVRIIVEDTGIGLTQESLPLVFQRFWQADATHTRIHGGLGLGLALARHFVELHGGEVSVHSEGLGRGAKFEILLPTTNVASSQNQPINVA